MRLSRGREFLGGSAASGSFPQLLALYLSAFFFLIESMCTVCDVLLVEFPADTDKRGFLNKCCNR